MARIPIFALLLVLLAVPCGPALAEDQRIDLAGGFNFVGVLVANDRTSGWLLAGEPALQAVFAFDPDRQAFTYQLRLSGGSLFGPSFPLVPLRGYVFECAGAATVTLPDGGAPAGDPLAGLRAGFNLVPVPALAGRSAAALFIDRDDLRSIFRWNPGAAAFDGLLRLPDGPTFGADFAFGPAATAYFLNVTGAGPAPPLASIAIAPAVANVPAGLVVDLAAETVVTATYEGGSTAIVAAGLAWSVVSGAGLLDGATYATAEADEQVVLRATYVRGGISRSADLTLLVVPAVPDALAFAVADLTVAAGATCDLLQAGPFVTYDNRRTAAVTTGLAWSIVSGGGSLAGSNWTAPAAAGTATLRASYTEGPWTVDADLPVVVRAPGSGAPSGGR